MAWPEPPAISIAPACWWSAAYTHRWGTDVVPLQHDPSFPRTRSLEEWVGQDGGQRNTGEPAGLLLILLPPPTCMGKQHKLVQHDDGLICVCFPLCHVQRACPAPWGRESQVCRQTDHKHHVLQKTLLLLSPPYNTSCASLGTGGPTTL